MTITASNILLTGSVLLLISIIAGKTSGRLGVPTLLFFLLVGMLAGSEGIGGIYFDNIFIAQFIGITALNFILFSGGLDTSFKSIKPVLRKGIALSTIGVLITTVTVGYFVHLVLGLKIAEFHAATEPCIPLSKPVTYDDGRRMEGVVALGQSWCVLENTKAGEQQRAATPVVPKWSNS
jgi:hypothetical protein